jgi:ATP-dependent exoDNAse (exonuclease V) beta subunit
VEKAEIISEGFVATESDEDDRGENSRGFSWGSVVHGALAAAAVDSPPEFLRGTCRDLLREYQRPLDDLGEPIELTELLQVVGAVRASELWTRALEADKMMVEVPFAVQHEGIQAVGDSESPKSREKSASGFLTARQMDIFSTTESPKVGDKLSLEEDEPLLQVIEGVVDLVFREDGGWVIVDYKTDLGTDPDFSSRLENYRQQVDLYADAWARLTGDPVKERILFFTAQDRLESW